MLTRRATSKEMEDKLRKTLTELEASKRLCQQLLQEREDSEIEIIKINDKNTSLKNELAELHIQYIDVLDQHEQLRTTVSTFQQCNDTHDLALSRITELERDLTNAQNTISILQSVKDSEQASDTQRLYDRLVGTASVSECTPTITIDLTGDDTQCPLIMSHKKLKKYIKIKKLIRLSQKVIKKQNFCKMNINFRKERVRLYTELNNCQSELDNCRGLYESDIQRLQDELLCKESLLRDIFSRYEYSQSQLSECMMEASELMDIVKYNAERMESFTNNVLCNCACTVPLPELQASIPLTEAVHPSQQYVPEPQPSVPLTEELCSQLYDKKLFNKTILFTDKLGIGFGSLMQNCLTSSVVNNCYPNLGFKDIVEKAVNSNLDNKSIVVLLLGNSIGLKRKDIVNGIGSLLQLNVGKIMVCALPYSNLLPDSQNKIIN